MNAMMQDEYQQARKELAAALSEFNEVTEPVLVDAALMRLEAAEKKLRSIIAHRRYLELYNLDGGKEG